MSALRHLVTPSHTFALDSLNVFFPAILRAEETIQLGTHTVEEYTLTFNFFILCLSVILHSYTRIENLVDDVGVGNSWKNCKLFTFFLLELLSSVFWPKGEAGRRDGLWGIGF